MTLGPEGQTSRERDFGYAMVELYEKTCKQTKDWANDYLRSVRKHGGAQAARRVLQADTPGSKPSKGFMTILHMARLDLTLEREILRPRWDGLFTDEEREFCRRRLADYGYRPRSDTNLGSTSSPLPEKRRSAPRDWPEQKAAK